MADDLTTVKDDMTAFIEGQGMRRFHGYVDTEEVPAVAWDHGNNPESWKDFVELAKAAGSTFLVMHSFTLSREDVDYVVDTLRNSTFADDDDMEEARWLRSYVGKTGFVQLSWPNSGIMFVYEASTSWHERYERLSEMAEEFDGLVFDGGETSEE